MESPDQRKFNPSEKGEIFKLLSNHRRRYTIHYCKQHNGGVSLSELAEQIAAWEHDKEVNEITSDERKRVYTSLQQTHLNRLEDAGMITQENGQIKLTENAQDLEVYLDIVPESSIPWAIYYLGLAAIAGVGLVGFWLGMVPTDLVSELAWATLITIVFAISAVVHTLQNRKYQLGESDKPL